MITQNLETLRNPSLDFTGTDEELKTLISLLEFELKSSPGQKGVGLSAIQINVPMRVAIIRHEKTVINLYNAVITKTEQPYTFTNEGCLSFPQKFIDTTRFNLIEVLNGDGTVLKFSGFISACVQHEIDHFNAILYLDRSAK